MVNNVVSLEQMMVARESRARCQRKHARAGCVLVSLTLNIPGPVKRLPLTDRAFRAARGAVESRIAQKPIELRVNNCGHFALYRVEGDALAIKRQMAEIEQRHPLGRLMDIDVLDDTGSKIERAQVGLPERCCLLCGAPAHECARSRAHPVPLLQLAAGALMVHYIAAQAAGRALLLELEATPKPGLVDRANSGAHSDMDRAMFLRSIAALAPFFGRFAALGVLASDEKALWESLRQAGIEADVAMLQATGCVNTHRGAVFLLGLIAGAYGLLYKKMVQWMPFSILDTAAAVARHALTDQSIQGRGGARSEAANGFPSVQLALGWLRGYLSQGASQNDAGVCTLLRLIARVPDTNLAARSDAETAGRVRRDVAARIEGKTVPALVALAGALDGEFIARNLSPGGCADLLAAAWMIHLLCTEEEREHGD